MSSVVRRASHAGSWYSSDRIKLNNQLQKWLSEVTVDRQPARAIISPHAGYDYSGPCAAFAYKQIDPRHIKRIFVLGPAHYMSLRGKCALSTADFFETPLYSLSIGRDVYQDLEKTGEFVSLTLDKDEEEHSIEMQMPYIAKMMEGYQGKFSVVPILVGYLTPEREAVYGQIFSRYLSNPENFFVISSDFCHWGKRFQYTYYDQSKGAIWQSIQALDETASFSLYAFTKCEIWHQTPFSISTYISSYMQRPVIAVRILKFERGLSRHAIIWYNDTNDTIKLISL
ncbi:unnamed protein product [Schistosoma intercalatum]|nr:unnamed protein product [Schistosoma intercalatum]